MSQSAAKHLDNMKTCKQCGVEKELSEFNKDGKGYYYNPCKKCCATRYKKWQQDNRDYVREYQKQWVSENRDKHNEYNRNRNSRLKLKVFDYYGNKCSCCGETESKFLTIDHVNNDGAAHRKVIHGDKIYPHIIKENFPNTFQILCWNCNLGKMLNKGICPHKSK